MAHPIIERTSQLLRHAVGVLLLAWLRALRAGAIAALLGIVAVEVAAVLMTHQFPPGGIVQLVAAALGAALAYGVAVTVIVGELITGIAEAISLLMGEAEAGARAAAAIAEREVGEASGSVLRAVGLGALLGSTTRAGQSPERIVTPFPATPPMSAPGPATPASAAQDVPAASTAEAAHATEETLADLAPDADVPSPRPHVDAGPVPAGQLPRITWIDEQPTVPLVPVAPPEPEPARAAREESASLAAPTPETAGMRDEEPDASEAISLPLAGPMAQQPFTTDPAAPAPAGMGAGGAQAGGAGPGLAEPAVWHDEHVELPGPEQWHDPSPSMEPEEAEEEAGIQPVDLFGAPPPSAESRSADSSTRPLPETTHPLDAASASPALRGSVWEHISQVLAGRPVEPLPAEDDASSGEDAPSGGATPPGV